MKSVDESQSAVKRICFTAHHAYPLFDPRASACIGGLETHACLLATGLADHPDWDVHFVVQAPRRFRLRSFGNVTVWNRGDGLDGIRNAVARDVHFDEQRRMRLKHWRFQLLWQIPLLALMRPFRDTAPPPTEADPFYEQITPDVFCCFGVSAESASVIATANKLQRPSVLFLESNNDLDARFTPDSSYVTPTGEKADVCHFAIIHSTTIVVQHQEQQRCLQERFGRESTVLLNPIDLEAWDRQAAIASPLLNRLNSKRFVLWVGRADDFHKRPHLLLELAESLPEVSFLMVLNPFDETIEAEIRSRTPSNVTIVSSIPHHEMPNVLKQASVLVSTASAEYEGAPNVFLQAAASGTPVASLEVPLSIRSEAGWVAEGRMEKLREVVCDCWQHPERTNDDGRRARQDIEQEHNLPVIIEQLNQLLEPLTSTGS